MAWTPDRIAKAHATQTKNRAAAAATKPAKPDIEPAEPLRLKRPASMAKRFGVLVTGLNDVLLMFPLTREDALNRLEAEMLIEGLDSAQMASPAFRKWVSPVASGLGFLDLGMAIFAITFARLARRGMIPGLAAEQYAPMSDEQIEQILLVKRRMQAEEAQAAEQMQPLNYAPEAVFTNGGTPPLSSAWAANE
jgi:hypothetical protein